MKIDPEKGIFMTELENQAIGRTHTDEPWNYFYRSSLFTAIRSRKAMYDDFDPTSLPHGGMHARLTREQLTLGPVLETMLQELAPHVETGIGEEAEAFLRELSD